MKTIGLFLGGGALSAVNTQKKTIISTAGHPLLSEGESGQDEFILTEAALNKLSREMNVGKGDDVYLSLHDRDFIFRSFVIPCMSRKEIESSIEFEIEKYIPFKIHELVWNYSYEKIANEKKLIVSFVGYNKISFKKLGDTFSKLDLDLVAVEPSILSLLRLIRNQKAYSRLNWYALLDYSPHECFITFFYRTLPVFSRTIFSSRTEELSVAKLEEEIRFSCQFFTREFRAYELERMLIFSDPQYQQALSPLIEDLDLSMDFVALDEFVSLPGVNMEKLKAFAATTYDSLPFKFRPFLEDIQNGFIYGKKGMTAPLNIPLLGMIAVIGVGSSLLLNTYTGSVLSGDTAALQRKKAQLELNKNIKDDSLNDLKDLLKKKQSDLKLLKGKIDSLQDTSPFLKRLPYCMPEGLWLEKLDIRKDPQGKLTAQVAGYVYRDNPQLERESFDEFISRIRADEVLKGVFSEAVPLSQEREHVEGFDVTYFTIKLK